jgi:hypothetical protein
MRGLLLDEGRDGADPKGSAGLVEGVAEVAHDLAVAGNATDFLGELKQG